MTTLRYVDNDADTTRCILPPARALANDPGLLILDELHSELDLFMRNSTQRQIVHRNQKSYFSTLFMISEPGWITLQSPIEAFLCVNLFASKPEA